MSRYRKLKWTMRITFVAFVLSFAIFYVLNRNMQARAEPRTSTDPKSAPQRYTLIVLGAFSGKNGPSDVLEDRLATALALYRAGKAQKILVSGDHGRDDYDEVNAMRAWLVKAGVPSDAVFMDHAGFRTLDTMERAAQIFQVTDALVVTQAFHMARALFLAQSAGIDAYGVTSDLRQYAWEDHYARREFLARALSWFDVKLFRRGPKFLGQPIPITGSAVLTHDAGTK